MTVTVLPGPERRQRWTSAEKLKIVEESLAGEATVAEVARRNDVHPNQLHGWRRELRAQISSSAPDGGARFVPVRIATRERLLPARGAGGNAAHPIEVVLGNGRVLRVPDGAAVAHVVALADALEGRG
jgi:transposase